MKKRVFNILTLLTILSIVLVSCGSPKPRKALSEMDNPEHHANNGNKFLEKGEISKAYESFERALELDSEYTPAIVGKAIVYGKKEDYKAAFKIIKKAKGIEKHVGMIRLYSMERGENWYKEVNEEFEKGMEIDKNNTALWFYAGTAHKVNYVFDKAGDAFKKVLEINKDYTQEANQEWAQVQKIQRAAPGTKIGNKIALIDSIDRASTAALFIEELNLEKLYKKKGSKNIDNSFKAPEANQFEAETAVKAPKVSDINNHVLKADIETVIDIQVRGLEAFPDHTFQPNKKITRVEYAVMIEDIIIKITGDESIATKFIGAISPYTDVRNDHFAFNAIMTVTTRGILEVKTSGEFGMQDNISGADALLAIRKLKEELKI